MIDYIISYLYAIPAILISMSFHELSHAYVSYLNGDPTAKNLGRISLNPFRHLDPLGTLMLFISIRSGFGFGWAKPVPINPFYYKNKKRGTVLVSLAGPLSNFLLAFIFSFPMAYIPLKLGISEREIYDSSIPLFASGLTAAAIIFNLSRFFYLINIGLGVFNLLPIPPLDGSKILSAVLPQHLYFRLMEYERYIGLVFLAVMFFRPEILSTVLGPLRRAVEFVIMNLGLPIVNAILSTAL